MAIFEQAVEFSNLAPNMIVKIPATAAGIDAIEEATYHGISINATVSFTLPQAIAVGEAVERGLKRREGQGKEIASMGPVCTIMVGRLDDWLKVLVEKDNIAIDPGYLEWAGVAVLKKAYRIYRERGYRTRLLSAAFRNHMHWSEFIGGDLVISPPYSWQVRFNASDIEVRSRIDEPVRPKKLKRNFPESLPTFVARAPNTVSRYKNSILLGQRAAHFASSLLPAMTLDAVVRDVLIPNPDVA